MSTFFDRLREERKRLGLNQTDFAAIGGVKKETQSNYETGIRRPDSAYLEAIAAHGVDVGYLLTGIRAPAVTSYVTDRAPTTHVVAEPVVRYVTPEQAALLDNYDHAEEEDKAAARRFLDVASQRKGPARRSA